MTAAGFDGFLVPRADAFQGEYVAARDERLAWLTGFTGSAGLCVVLRDTAGLFVDGRYTIQAAAQADPDHFSIVNWPKTQPGSWIAERLPEGGRIGFDPWLHTPDEIDKLSKSGAKRGITYCSVDNFVDLSWSDQPAPPIAPIHIHPTEFAGETHGSKRDRLARDLTNEGFVAAVLTLPDSIAWLLNIRGGDIPKNPVVHAFALLFSDGSVKLFCEKEKLIEEVITHLGETIAALPPADFEKTLQTIDGKVLFDPSSAPWKVRALLRHPHRGTDPCKLPKAVKNRSEISGMERAHQRDGIAVTRFLAWLDGVAGSGSLTEIDVVRKLEAFRVSAPEMRDISFDTIAGSGPNGAIVHYRVTEATNRTITPGDLLLVDSGAQYVDGTTDITRTVATGPCSDDVRACFTRVLKGMIAISRARWPAGLAGRDLDALARSALWQAGQDYDHGTGHGVGAYLCVHEGPHGLSRRSEAPLEPGMVLSNEPGYYRPGAFGIRIENLVLVEEAPDLPGGDADRKMLQMRTLTFAPIDRRLIRPDLLLPAELAWLDMYHAEVRTRLSPFLDDATAAWLADATAPLAA